jgi:hypothetical protein
MFDDLSKTAPNFLIWERLEAANIDIDQLWLMKGTHEVFARAKIHTGLAPH